MIRKGAIGILGGMGPKASSYLYETLIDLSVKYFGAKNNDDFPEIILYSIPVPDFISSSEKKEKALKMLVARVKSLNKLNLLCLSIACNTAHVLLDKLQDNSKAPFVSMIDEVVKTLGNTYKTVGLLGTPSTIEYNLYQNALKKVKILTITPNTQQIKTLEQIIRNVLAGKLVKQDTQKLIKIADSLKKRGAKGIILGCTELPLVFPKKYDLPIYNSVKILAMALLQKYYKQNTI